MNYYYYPEKLKEIVKQYKENPNLLKKAFGVKNYSKLTKKQITDKNGHKKTVWVRTDKEGKQFDGNLQKQHFSLAMIVKKLLSKFGIGLEKIKSDYEEVSKSFDVDKTTFANHVYEYFSHKEKYDKLFSKKAAAKKVSGKRGGAGKSGGKKSGGATGEKKERVKIKKGSNNDKRLLRAIYKLNNKKAPPLSTTQNNGETNQHGATKGQPNNRTVHSSDNISPKGDSVKAEKDVKVLDAVKPEIVELARNAGLDIEGYKHKVTDDFARHVIKKHGNKKEEAKRGQIAVTQKDLDNIKTVMNTPDIAVAGVKKNGKDRIVLVKNTEHGSILVEEVLSGRRNKTLNAKTFWIMDKTIDEAKIQKIISNTKGYDVSKIKVASLTGTNSVLSSSKDEGGSNSAVKTATNALEKTRAKGQDHKGDLSNDSNIAQKNDSVNVSMINENKRRALKLVAQSPVTYKGKKWNVNLNSDGTLRLTSTQKNALGVYTNIDATTPEKIKNLLDAVEGESELQAHQNRSTAMQGNQNAKGKRGGGGNSGNAFKFSSLSEKEKEELGKKITSSVVSEIGKDTVAYNETESVADLAKEWIKANPQGNADTFIGDVIINEKSVSRDMHHGNKDDLYLKLQTLPAVKDILEKGTYLGYEKDFDSKNIDNHYFAGKIKYGDDEKIVFCRVRENAGDESRFYVHEVFTEDEIKKEASQASVVDVGLPRLTGKPLYSFILQDVLKVKGKNKTAFENNTADSVKKAWVAKGRLYVNKAMAKKLRVFLR